MDDEERKENIIMAAHRLFARFGLKKTTMEEIAREAGVGKATIYKFFDGKEAVFSAVLRVNIERMLALMREAINSASTVRDKLGEPVKALVHHLRKQAREQGFNLDVFPEMRSLVESEGMYFYDEAKTLLADVLRGGAKRGEVAVSDPVRVADTVVTAFRGLETPNTYEASDREITAKIDDLLELILKGIEPR